ncbi:MAG TPA: DNA-3-methyladenine glycosylase [Methanomicrobiales archaeon]|nr:DNA-3-methyladenine glycosylase [Methanomicrobiales archaeon]
MLSPVPPFDFDLSASIFSGGDPDIRSYRDGAFRQALRLGGGIVLVTVTSEGTVDKPLVRVGVRPGPVGTGVTEAAGAAVSKLFNLDLDLAPFTEAVKGDPVMSALARRLRGLKSPRTATLFEALVDSIVEQQISLAAAHGIERRVVRTFGDTVAWEGTTYHAFPSPERLAGSSVDALRACGLSSKKAEYILGIARGVRDGTLDLEAHGPDEDTSSIVQGLTAIRGVGTWTAELAALRGLSRLDAIPADDLGIRRVISRFYSRAGRIDAGEARRIAEAWGAWKGLAAYYLIVAELKGIGS